MTRGYPTPLKIRKAIRNLRSAHGRATPRTAPPTTSESGLIADEGGFESSSSYGEDFSSALVSAPCNTTIAYDPSTNELTFRWKATGVPEYKVYSADSPEGPFTTLVGTTSTTSLTVTRTTDKKLYYTVVANGSWDQIGIDHNRGLGYGLSQMSQDFDTTWTEEQIQDSIASRTLGFVRDSTCYNLTLANFVLSDTSLSTWFFGDTCLVQWVSDSTNNIFNFQVTQETRAHYFDVFEELQIISLREEQFILRLFDILYFDTLQSDSAFIDSLESLEEDFYAVSWNNEEIICPALVSIALHSWEFHTEGWTYVNGDSVYSIDNVRPEDVETCIKKDVAGAISGVGTLATIVWSSTQAFGTWSIIAGNLWAAAAGPGAGLVGGVIIGAAGVGAIGASWDSFINVFFNDPGWNKRR